jgi:phenylacetate-CoA ligase
MKKICDLKKFGIKKLFSNSEPLPLSIREKMEMEWGADVFETYGLVEIGISVAGECKQKNGMHVDESSFFVEVVDPKTGEQLENGELGELVFTTLNREGMPLIRYRSHDLGSIIAEECECGSPLQRIKIKGRTDDMVIIGTGDNVFAEMFDKALFSLPEVMEYQIVLNKKNARDHMAITVETDSTSDKTREKILKSLFKIDAIRDGIMNSKTIAKPSIKLVKPGTIDRKIKVKKIIDNRNLYS